MTMISRMRTSHWGHITRS